MIDMVGFANFYLTVVALPFLIGILLMDILRRMRSAIVLFTSMAVTSNYISLFMMGTPIFALPHSSFFTMGASVLPMVYKPFLSVIPCIFSTNRICRFLVIVMVCSCIGLCLFSVGLVTSPSLLPNAFFTPASQTI